jgi:hypothetical protein
MRHMTDESAHPSTWMGCKEKGRRCYERSQYEDSLDAYKAALSPDFSVPKRERQILLSNIVACRLKIGGHAQAAAAVESAKQCVELNPSWGKGHVRLASAYIALTGHSNDACNALQTALRLDSGNILARKMLLRELRRDHHAGAAADLGSVDGGVDEDDKNGEVSHTPRSNETSTNDQTAYTPGDHFDPATHHRGVEDPIDDSLTLCDRVRFFASCVSTWYSSQSSDTKMLVKGTILVVCLYVGFGGLFGLDRLFSTNRPQRGYYGPGNAYDQYRRGSSTSHGSYYGDLRKTYRSTNDSYNQDSARGTGGGGFDGYQSMTGSYGIFDGGLTSLAILLGAAYVCHRNGINPLHAMLMMNGLGRRRRGFGRGFGGAGMMRGFGGGRMPRRRARW